VPSRNEGENSVSEVETTPDIPVVLHQGRYRLYKKPDGGLRLQYRRDDKDEDDFFELPGMMVRLLDRAQAGNMSPMEFMREAMKLKRA
jgi:hypothetical protein